MEGIIEPNLSIRLKFFSFFGNFFFLPHSKAGSFAQGLLPLSSSKCKILFSSG